MPFTENDHYAVLGVARDASQDEIKKAFRRMARETHPDANSDHDAEERFKRVNEAYEVLSNPQKRSMYDQFGTTDPRQAGGFGMGFEDFFGGGSGVEDIFSVFFGGAAGGRQRVSTEGRDMAAMVTVSLEEAATGVTHKLEYVRAGSCGKCSGTGSASGAAPGACPDCGGAGQRTTSRRTLFGTMQTATACPSCGGTGQAVADPCPACAGSGRTRTQEAVEVEVPAGVREGAVVTLQGMGEAGIMGGAPGDLRAEVRVLQHEHFFRDGDDLHARVSVPLTAAVLGGRVSVPGLLGPIQIDVPAGSQEGDVVRVKGEGMTRPGGRGRGDLHAYVRVDVPRKLDRKQKKLLEELAAMQGEKARKANLDPVSSWLRR